MPPCELKPLNDTTPEYQRFWDNLSLAFCLWPDWSIAALVEDASELTAIHMSQNVFCSWHGRQQSADNRCPCEGHPPGVHTCRYSLKRPPPSRVTRLGYLSDMMWSLRP